MEQSILITQTPERAIELLSKALKQVKAGNLKHVHCGLVSKDCYQILFFDDDTELIYDQPTN